jgi:hypothetical protein
MSGTLLLVALCVLALLALVAVGVAAWLMSASRRGPRDSA